MRTTGRIEGTTGGVVRRGGLRHAVAICKTKCASLSAQVRHHLEALQRLELIIVNSQRQACDRGLVHRVACASNWLGNGWLYLFVAIFLLLSDSARADLVLLSAGIATALAHAVYPWIKRRVARVRPFERLPQLLPSIPVLDRYSFPSGHCMTATATAIPFAQGYPELTWAAVVVWALIAWGRIACGHHYPSDLLAGGALGAGAAYGSGTLLLAFQFA